MTTWVEEPGGGRARGPRGLARALVEVVFRPQRFFRTGISPGDQAPGLTFVMTVVLIEEGLRLMLIPEAVPAIAGSRLASGIVILALAVLLVTPAALHLVAGLQTVLLIPITTERGGVSETVQVLAYATAPCVLVGAPSPSLRVICSLYGASLYLLGLTAVHDLEPWQTAVAGLLPAGIVFGIAFRGFPALVAVLEGWHVI